MLKNIKYAENLEGKRVLVRVGVNVPLDFDKNITSDFRLKKVSETINFLLEHNAKVILMGHLGRDLDDSLEPVFNWFAEENFPIAFDKETFKDFSLEKVKQLQDKIDSMKNGSILLLDNLRQSEKESQNDEEFSKNIASLGDIYVNEAFSVSHRNHSSMVGVPSLFKEKYIGILLEKELQEADKILNPGENSIAILGGAKIKTKLPLLDKISDKFSLNIIGGRIVNNFYKFLKYEIGEPNYDRDFLDLKKYFSDKLFIPNIVIVSDGKKNKVEKEISEVVETDKIYDISPNSFFEIEEQLKSAKFVFFNGPLGFFEAGYDDGTKYLLEILANKNNYFIAGGGDTATAIFKLGLEANVDWISTGGGALIDYLADGSLPALEILKK